MVMITIINIFSFFNGIIKIYLHSDSVTKKIKTICVKFKTKVLYLHPEKF